VKKAEVFKMPSGADLHVGMAEFVQSSALMQAILKQLVGLKLSPADLQKDFTEIQNNPGGVMALVDKAISMATSNEVKAAIFDCAQSVKYAPKANNALIPVDASLFDDLEFGLQAREDYYTICYRIAEVNCKPFFVKTFSGLLKPKQEINLVAPALK
jgi:hypothetical protein